MSVLGRLDDRWVIREHDDGTVNVGAKPGVFGGPTTVTPSIWDSPQGWHGWLDHGVWRSV